MIVFFLQIRVITLIIRIIVKHYWPTKVLEKKAWVSKEEIIKIVYKSKKENEELKLRRISYQDDKNRLYTFITNNFTITAEEVALIYKKRWGIEILFKWNFRNNLYILWMADLSGK